MRKEQSHVPLLLEYTCSQLQVLEIKKKRPKFKEHPDCFNLNLPLEVTGLNSFFEWLKWRYGAFQSVPSHSAGEH